MYPKKSHSPVFVAALACCLASTLNAQEIKVDLNAHNRPLSETADPAYTSWNTNSIWFAGGTAITNTFNDVTFVFRHGGSVGTGLTTDRYPAGLTTAGWNAKLVNDGITVAPLHIANTAGSGGPGARIELTISGLTAGQHTLLTWHNTWQNPANWSFSPIHVHVNGVQVITNLPVSNRVTNNADASYSFVQFESDGIADTVITYEASTDFTATDAQPCINGFELNTPDFKFKANKPSPAHNNEHVDADADKSVLLSWTPAALAVSHHVYFGTDSNAVRNATVASPEFLGTQTATNRLVTGLSSKFDYFWRVDEVDGGNGVTKGDLWKLRIRRLAFPGAEGYGRFARGGRGGVVVKVTNLNDSGPGSLRDAIKGNYGPRTIVFDVAGLITLESPLIVSGTDRYITIAGQTAPGNGICVRKNQLGVSGGDDLIIRYVRSRPGDIAGITLNGSGMAGANHSIMDHCSVSWGIDEEISSRGAKNMTLQRVLISEALHIAGHKNYDPGTSHGFAASIGGDIASFHHNLLAHCEGRNWSLAGGLDASGRYAGKLDIFNNVVYNWRGRTTDGGAHQVNFVNNYYKAGPASTQSRALNAQYGGFPGTQQYYFEGNVMTPGGSVGSGFTVNNQAAGKTTSTESGGTLPENSNPPYSPWVNQPFFPSFATIDEVTNAYKRVLSDVGCNLPQIDAHDARVIRETIGGTYTYTGSISGRPGLPDSQNDVGGWGNMYPTVTRPVGWDTDDDGLPDWWEMIHGLNPSSAPGDFSDANGDPDGDEFTNLEDYINWMATPHAACDAGSFVDIDLTALTRGFTNNNPVYSVLTQSNGVVSLINAGRTARFTPMPVVDALGGFSFQVVDAHGYNMTRTVNLRIIADAAPAQPPVLGIRNQNGELLIELTGESGRTLTVQTNGTPTGAWATWTNVTGTGAMQLLPLNGAGGQSSSYFRAFAE
ncbi:MAG TPA: T9SS C-terminal target domain-containing protein [Verrucomicrobiota bacterium]|mgnify:CR=1 FL=1|nr:T9SS C-terminal target domain-containing protein [Verrucomicrobiota bacterium]